MKKPIKLTKHLTITDIAKYDDLTIVIVQCEACHIEWEMDDEEGYMPVGDLECTGCKFCPGLLS